MVKLISKDSLLKLLHSGTKVLAEIGFQTISFLLANVCSPKLIQRLQEEMKGSKNTWAHSKFGHFLFLILSLYPFEGVLDRFEPIIETYL
mmetsp:Transcript_43444/g.41904  ORF Transcript_43444/g.41904 Transcript_43444/m.41904 type:complete len:90 (+) Transcript_43444:393-662(+)